jgi:hypothetical protein
MRDDRFSQVTGWIGCIGTALIFAAILTSVIGYFFFRPRGPAEVADEYFRLLGKGDTTAARQLAVTDDPRRIPGNQIEIALKKWGFDTYRSSSWPNVRIKKDEAVLQGTIENAARKSIGVVVRLVRQTKSWHISSVEKLPDPEPTPSAADDDD